jgi:ABC-type lipoprotein release transport system permease subunit
MKSIIIWTSELFRSIRVGWFLATRQIQRASKWTTGLIIFVMTLTFLNLVVVSGLLVGLISGSFVQFRDHYSGDILITPPNRQTYIKDSTALVSYLSSHPDVELYSARYLVGAGILGTLDRLPKSEQKINRANLSVAGIDPLNEEAMTHLSKFVKYGKPLMPGDTQGILIGANILKKYSSFADANIPGLTLLEDVDIGSRVRLTIPSLDGGAPIAKEYFVRGIVKSKIDEVSARAFILDEEVRRLIPTRKLDYQEIAVRTNPGKEAAVLADIRAFTGTGLSRVQSSQEAIPTFLRDIETTMGILGNALSSIALVVATITIFIVIFINAITKRKFIGIMKGIGISPFAVQLSYVIQAFFYGAVGSAIGVALTFGLLKPFFDKNPINFPFSDGILVATPEGALLRIGILMVVVLLAGYIPAWLIVRKNTLDAILGR